MTWRVATNGSKSSSTKRNGRGFRNAGAMFSADVLDTEALHGSKWAENFQATHGIGSEVVSRFYKTRADLKPFHLREKRQKLVAQPQHQRDPLKHRIVTIFEAEADGRFNRASNVI